MPDPYTLLSSSQFHLEHVPNGMSQYELIISSPFHFFYCPDIISCPINYLFIQNRILKSHFSIYFLFPTFQ